MQTESDTDNAVRAIALIAGPPGQEQTIALEGAIADENFDWTSLKPPFTFELSELHYNLILEQAKKAKVEAKSEPEPPAVGKIVWQFERQGNRILQHLSAYGMSAMNVEIRRHKKVPVPVFWCPAYDLPDCTLTSDNQCVCVDCKEQCVANEGANGWYCRCTADPKVWTPKGETPATKA